MAVQMATPVPSTFDETLTRPSDAPVYSTSFPFTRFGRTPIQLRYAVVLTVLVAGGVGVTGLVSAGLTAVHDFGCGDGGSVNTNGFGSGDR